LDDEEYNQHVDNICLTQLIRLRQLGLLKKEDIRGHKLIERICYNHAQVFAERRFQFLFEWNPIFVLQGDAGESFPLYVASFASPSIRLFQVMFGYGIRYYPHKTGIILLFTKSNVDYTTVFQRACRKYGRDEVMKVVEDTLNNSDIPINTVEALFVAAIDEKVHLDCIYSLLRRQPAVLVRLLSRLTNNNNNDDDDNDVDDNNDNGGDGRRNGNGSYRDDNDGDHDYNHVLDGDGGDNDNYDSSHKNSVGSEYMLIASANTNAHTNANAIHADDTAVKRKEEGSRNSNENKTGDTDNNDNDSISMVDLTADSSDDDHDSQSQNKKMPTTAKWKCPRCTLFNGNSASICYACDYNPMDDDDNTWKCPSCTLINSEMLSECEACGKISPPSAAAATSSATVATTATATATTASPSSPTTMKKKRRTCSDSGKKSSKRIKHK